MPFIAYNRVRMHDTDAAGIIFFANQFRFAHETLEDFAAHEGLSFERLLHQEDFLFVVVHTEADYLAALKIGDALEVHLTVSSIGTTSFGIHYQIFRLPDKELVGTVETMHVTLDTKTRKKIPIPGFLKQILEKYKD